MSFHWEHIGFRYAYEQEPYQMILDIQKTFSLDPKILGVLAEHRSEALFPVRITEDQDSYHFYYDITNVTNLVAWRAERPETEQQEVLCLLPGIVNRLLEMEIDPGQLLISDQYIFRDNDSGQLLFLCLPFTDAGLKKEILQVSQTFLQKMAGELWNANPYRAVRPEIAEVLGEETDRSLLLTGTLVRKATGETFTISARRTIIGSRKEVVDLHLSGNPAISRQHCVVNQEGGRFFLTDLDSQNATQLDGKTIERYTMVELYSGSSLRMADEEFCFEIGRA